MSSFSPFGSREHSAFVDAYGVVRVSGRGLEGQLGPNTTPPVCDLVRVLELPPCRMVATGARFTACVTRDGRVFCFGQGEQGQLGQGHGQNLATPHQVCGLPPIRQVACGADFVMCVGEDSTLWAFGNNQSGQLGLGHRNQVNKPCQVKGVQARQVACGNRHTLILTIDGKVLGCGRGDMGELGREEGSSLEPVAIHVSVEVLAVHCGSRFSIIQGTDHTLWSGGHDGCGQLGRNDHTTFSNEFHQIPNLLVEQVSCGYEHVMAIDKDGNLWGWGQCIDSIGSQPVLITQGVSAVLAGSHTTFFRTTEGEVMVRGVNGEGQLALGDQEDVPTWISHPSVEGDMIPSSALSFSTEQNLNLEGSLEDLVNLLETVSYDHTYSVFNRIAQRGIELQSASKFKEARSYYEAFLEKAESHDVDWSLRATVWHHLGTLTLVEGDYSTAENHFLKVLDPRTESAPVTAESYGLLALAQWKMGRYHEAQRNYATAMRLAQKIMPGSAKLAEIYNNFALLHSSRGKIPDSVRMFEKALAINQDLFGEDSAQAATTMSNLGTELYGMGLFNKATNYFEKALNLRQQRFGTESAQYASTLVNYAFCQYEQSDLQGAQQKLKEAIRIRTKLFGENSINITAALDRLGEIYQALGKHEKAMRCYERTESIRILSKCERSLRAAVSQNLRAALLIECDQLDAAKTLLEDTMNLLQKTESHSKHLATAQLTMAKLYEKRGLFDQASDYLSRGMELRDLMFDHSSPQRISAESQLAALRVKQGRIVEADSLYHEIMETMREIYGDSSLMVAENLNNWASLHLQTGALSDAKECVHRAMNIQAKAVGSQSKQMAESFHKLGQIAYQEAMNAENESEDPDKKKLLFLEESRRHLENAAEITRKIFGESSAALGSIYQTLAMVYQARQETSPALLLIKAAKKMQSKVFRNAATTAPANLRLAMLYLEAGEMIMAHSYLRKALAPLEFDEISVASNEEGEAQIAEAEEHEREVYLKYGNSTERATALLKVAQVRFRYCCFMVGCGFLEDGVTLRNQKDQTGSKELRDTLEEVTRRFYEIAEELSDMPQFLPSSSKQ